MPSEASTLRVVFMGTPEFALPALEAVAKNFQLVGVYTQPDRPVGRGLDLRASPVKARALELGAPVFQPDKLSQAGEFERLQALSPDVIVVVAYGQILRRNILDLPRLGCVNIHSSLLPRWRGAAPIQWAILAGDAQSGVSTMKLVEKLDAGDVLMQKATPISAEDTAGALHDRLATMGAELIVPTLRGLSDHSLIGKPQDEAAVTYASKLTKEMEQLDPSIEAAVLERRIRALNPWPGTSVMLGGQRLKIKCARLRQDISRDGSHRRKIFEKDGMLLLGACDGALELLSLQWEGKREIDAASFLNGLRGRGQCFPIEVDPPSLGTENGSDRPC